MPVVKQPIGALKRPTAAADLDPGNIRLQGQKISAKLSQAITAMTIESRIDGSSTLTITVYDYAKAFLRSQLMAGNVTLMFDGLYYTLVKTATTTTGVTLTFEETLVSLLRLYDTPKKADRATTTRAQFVRSLCTEVQEATIPYRIPEVNVREPIAPSTTSG